MAARRGTLAPEGPLGNALPLSSLPVPSSAMKKGPIRKINGRTSMLPVSTAYTTNVNTNANAFSTNNGYHQADLVRGEANAAAAMAASQQQQQQFRQQARVSTASGGAAGGGMGLSRSASQEQLGDRRSTVGQGGLGMVSTSKPDGGMYGRQSVARMAPGSVRRSSVYAGAGAPRQSMAPGAGGFALAAPKETRPIKDKQFQAACQRNIADWLAHRRITMAVNQKTLTSPTAKEFQTIFRFIIVDMVDPGFQWGKKIEDDILTIMKDLKYPAMEALGKTALSAPGTPQNWPGFLAMFNWLIDLSKALDDWQNSSIINDPFIVPITELPHTHPHFEDRLLWDFSSATYQQWFDQGAEEFPQAEAELEEQYNRLAQTTFDESEQLEARIKQRRAELQQLQATEPPLKKHKEEYVQLMSDKTKFIQFIDLHKQKHEKLRQAITRAKAAIADQESDEVEKQIEAARSELAQVEAAVAVQNLTPDEVSSMNSERDSLTRNIEDLRRRVTEAKTAAADKEVAVTRSMHRFDELAANYVSVCNNAGLIRDGAPGPGGVDYMIDLDLGITDVSELQASGSRMKKHIEPALKKLAHDLRLQLKIIISEIDDLVQTNEQLSQKIEMQGSDIKNCETKLATETEKFEEVKKIVDAEQVDWTKRQKKLETEIHVISLTTTKGMMDAEQELLQMRISYNEIRHKTSALQDTLQNEIGSHMTMIVSAKKHIEEKVKSIRTLAESQ